MAIITEETSTSDAARTTEKLFPHTRTHTLSLVEKKLLASDRIEGDKTFRTKRRGKRQQIMFNESEEAIARREFRSVKVPHHRLPPLRKKWIELYTPIVEHCKLEVRMNLKTNCVELRTCKDTVDVSLLQKAEDFVRATVYGFETRDAVALLRMDDIYLDSFEVKDVRAGLSGDNLSRAVGRLSGSHGKTKFTIENLTRTRIVIADTHIYVLGTTQNTRVARDALCDLICGSPAAKVTTRIRGVMNRVHESNM